MDNTAVCPLPIDRAADVMAFLRRFYGPMFYGAEERYFSWLYLESPCRWYAPRRAAGEMPVNAILDQSGELLGIHAFLPFDAHTPWNGTRGIWDVEWLNGDGPRGGGRAMASRLLSDVDVYVGFGCNDLSATAFNRLGLTIVPEVGRRVFVIDPVGLSGFLRNNGFADMSGLASAACTIPGASFSLLNRAADAPDTALAAHAARTHLGVSRSRDWLAWRYDRHPSINYAPIACAGGVAIERIEHAGRHGETVARLLEFLPQEGHESPLLAAALAFASDKGALLMDYFSPSAAHLALIDNAAADLGWAGLLNPRLPYMFQPPAMTPANAFNMVIAAGGRAGGNVILPGEFHATKGDANQDVMRSDASAPWPAARSTKVS